jgi:hypothetical protein
MPASRRTTSQTSRTTEDRTCAADPRTILTPGQTRPRYPRPSRHGHDRPSVGRPAPWRSHGLPAGPRAGVDRQAYRSPAAQWERQAGAHRCSDVRLLATPHPEAPSLPRIGAISTCSLWARHRERSRLGPPTRHLPNTYQKGVPCAMHGCCPPSSFPVLSWLCSWVRPARRRLAPRRPRRRAAPPRSHPPAAALSRSLPSRGQVGADGLDPGAADQHVDQVAVGPDPGDHPGPVGADHFDRPPVLLRASRVGELSRGEPAELILDGICLAISRIGASSGSIGSAPMP